MQSKMISIYLSYNTFREKEYMLLRYLQLLNIVFLLQIFSLETEL